MISSNPPKIFTACFIKPQSIFEKKTEFTYADTNGQERPCVWYMYYDSCNRIPPDIMMASNGNIFRVTGPLWEEFSGHRWIPLTRPVTRSCEVFCDLRLNERLSKHSRRWWFETPFDYYDVTVMITVGWRNTNVIHYLSLPLQEKEKQYYHLVLGKNDNLMKDITRLIYVTGI